MGLGLLVAGGTGAVATGAFSAATAERDVVTEFEGDATAILAFEPTSRYADLDDGANGDVLSITFENLSIDADFTFQDTFRVVNNGTETVQFESVSSDGDDNDWNNETEEDEPGRVLIANEAGKWQGTPNEEYVGLENDDLGIEVNEEDTNGGHFPARDLTEGSGPALPPGEWATIGFRFEGPTGVGKWDPDEIPGTLRLGLGSVDT